MDRVIRVYQLREQSTLKNETTVNKSWFDYRYKQYMFTKDKGQLKNRVYNKTLKSLSIAFFKPTR